MSIVQNVNRVQNTICKSNLRVNSGDNIIIKVDGVKKRTMVMLRSGQSGQTNVLLMPNKLLFELLPSRFQLYLQGTYGVEVTLLH